MFVILLSSVEHKKTYPKSYKRCGDTSDKDRPSVYIHTNSIPKRQEFETQNCAIVILHIIRV